jgi:hypothetical protein
MMRRDVVFSAINRTGPPYVPIYFFNQDFDQSDIVAFDVQHHFQGPNRDQSEWGFTWERLDETMGQPRSYLLESWEDLPSLRIPDPHAEQRFDGVQEFAQQYADRYRLASLGLSGFTTMWCLRGFEQLMTDIALAPERVEALADVAFGFEEAVMTELPQRGFDGVAYFDDWGTQKRLLVSPQIWRERFKPRYAHQFDLAHRLGLHVYFHSCGQILEIVPDLIEAGVDILNISQPNLYDIPALAQRFRDQVCFILPVSYQTTSLSGTRAEIFADVQQLMESFDPRSGGLIGYVEEYHSMGMSQANYRACIEAFQSLGGYEQWRREQASAGG